MHTISTTFFSFGRLIGLKTAWCKQTWLRYKELPHISGTHARSASGGCHIPGCKQTFLRYKQVPHSSRGQFYSWRVFPTQDQGRSTISLKWGVRVMRGSHLVTYLR